MQKLKIYSSDNELYKIKNFSSIKDFDLIFKKIAKDSFREENETFSEINYKADFSEPKKVVYAYCDSEGSLTITDNLNTFSEGFRTEKEWRVEKWTEI